MTKTVNLRDGVEPRRLSFVSILVVSHWSCSLRFLEDASTRAVVSINKSRETTAVDAPADNTSDQ